MIFIISTKEVLNLGSYMSNSISVIYFMGSFGLLMDRSLLDYEIFFVISVRKELYLLTTNGTIFVLELMRLS